jgi:hypothetical protein
MEDSHADTMLQTAAPLLQVAPPELEVPLSHLQAAGVVATNDRWIYCKRSPVFLQTAAGFATSGTAIASCPARELMGRLVTSHVSLYVRGDFHVFFWEELYVVEQAPSLLLRAFLSLLPRDAGSPT